MSAQSKTEAATPKKKRDAALRGQAFKARDIVVTCSTVCGVLVVLSFGSLGGLAEILVDIMRSGFEKNLPQYARSVIFAGLWIIVPIILVSVLFTAIPSLLQSGFQLATRAIKLNLEAVDPIKGFKRIFSLRSFKDTIKAMLYLSSFCAALWIVWIRNRTTLFSQYYGNVWGVVATWKAMVVDLVLISLGCVFLILVLDALAELYFYLRELRMDKQEVKREFKEQEGDPMIKGKRREAHMEILSAQDRHDVENSKMIVTNPTHIAIGIYFKPEISPIPYVSIREQGGRALAIRTYAEKVGVPVIVDVPLARRMYQSHERYSMVSLSELRAIVELLLWLQRVERDAVAGSQEAEDRSDTETKG